MKVVEPGKAWHLADYEAWPYLAPQAAALREEATRLVPKLLGHRVWMVNSAASGGGVAELLAMHIGLLRDLGVEAHWAVIEPDRPEFFAFTKRLHNLIHDAAAPHPTAQDRALYDAASTAFAAQLRPLLQRGDVLIAHDPQPAGMAAILRRALGNPLIWRSHIGLDRDTPHTLAAWEFLRGYLAAADHVVFSAPEYIPDFVRERASVIYPSIDPLGAKNIEFSARKLQGILCNSRLAAEVSPVLYPPYEHPALRLSPQGEWRPATEPEEIGLLFRPIVTQLSRWDRLKGFGPLLEAFVLLKKRLDRASLTPLHERRLRIVRLVLAGPDPRAVADDPEAVALLGELAQRYRQLDAALQRDIALLVLPMGARDQNAYMVNVLQRCSSVVVQNSLQEGFGLTVSEAMWKRVAVLASRAVGPRHQIRDGVDGVLIDDPENAEELASTLDQMLVDPHRRAHLAGNAQRRVLSEFLVLREVTAWLRRLVLVVREHESHRAAEPLAVQAQ